MSVLESRYRRLLRVLPRAYRQVREDEMVAAFLAGEQADDPDNFDLTLKHGRPSVAEARAIAALAVRSRWGESVAPERFAVHREGLRSAVLLLLTASWAVTVASMCWWALTLALSDRYTGSGYDPWAALFGLPVGSWQWFHQWSIVAWLPTLPLVVVGGRIGARCAAVLAVVPFVAGMTATVWIFATMSVVWWGTLAALAINAAIFAGLTAMGWARGRPGEAASRGADSGEPGSGCEAALAPTYRPAPRPVRFLVVGCVAALTLTLPSALFTLGAFPVDDEDPPSTGWFAVSAWLFDEPAWWCWAAVIGAAWMLVRRLRGGQNRTPSMVALAVLAGAAAVYRGFTIVDSAPGFSDIGPPLAPAFLTQFALAAGICVVAAMSARRRIYQLPAPQYLRA